MRLEGVSNIAEGNPPGKPLLLRNSPSAFLATYKVKHNQRFAVLPASNEDANRPVLHSEEELELIFSKHHKETL